MTVTNEDVGTAIEFLIEMEHAEGDNDHEETIADIRRLVANVYDHGRRFDELYGDERAAVTRKVIESIDPEEQIVEESERAEKTIKYGLEFVDVYE